MSRISNTIMNNETGRKVSELFNLINNIISHLVKFYPELNQGGDKSFPVLNLDTNGRVTLVTNDLNAVSHLNLKEDFVFDEIHVEQFLDEFPTVITENLRPLANEVFREGSRELTRHATKLKILKDLLSVSSVNEFNRKINGLITRVNHFIDTSRQLEGVMIQGIKNELNSDLSKLRDLYVKYYNNDDSNVISTAVLSIDDHLARINHFLTLKDLGELEGLTNPLYDFKIENGVLRKELKTGLNNDIEEIITKVFSTYLPLNLSNTIDLGSKQKYLDTYVTADKTLSEVLNFDTINTKYITGEDVNTTIDNKINEIHGEEGYIGNVTEFKTKLTELKPLITELLGIIGNSGLGGTKLLELNEALLSPTAINGFNKSIEEIKVLGFHGLNYLTEYDTAIATINDRSSALVGLINNLTENLENKDKIQEYNTFVESNNNSNNQNYWRTLINGIKTKLSTIRDKIFEENPFKIYTAMLENFEERYTEIKGRIDTIPEGSLGEKEAYLTKALTDIVTLRTEIKNQLEAIPELKTTLDNIDPTILTNEYTIGSERRTGLDEYNRIVARFTTIKDELSDEQTSTLDQWDDRFTAKKNEIMELLAGKEAMMSELRAAIETIREESNAYGYLREFKDTLVGL